MSNQWLKVLLVSMATAVLAACGGGGGGDGDDEDEGPPDASGAGLWGGTHTIDGQTANQPMIGIVTEEGDYALLAINGAQGRLFFGTGTTNGNTFSANAVTYLNSQRDIPVSMQGTVTDGVSIIGSYSMNGQSAAFTLNYQAGQYTRPASLALLQGVYSATSSSGSSISVTVEASGTITGVYSSGCTFTGNAAVPHAERNYYRANVTFSSCGSANGAASLLMFLQDVAPSQNNQLSIFEQHQSQTLASILAVRK